MAVEIANRACKKSELCVKKLRGTDEDSEPQDDPTDEPVAIHLSRPSIIRIIFSMVIAEPVIGNDQGRVKAANISASTRLAGKRLPTLWITSPVARKQTWTALGQVPVCRSSALAARMISRCRRVQ